MSVSVHESMNGKGIGCVLVQGFFAAFAGEHIDSSSLWYAVSHPLSTRCWSRPGFLPLWTQFQSLHHEECVGGSLSLEANSREDEDLTVGNLFPDARSEIG
jgi:hypothetical protein